MVTTMSTKKRRVTRDRAFERLTAQRTCDEFKDYERGRLGGEVTLAFLEHVKNCPRCRDRRVKLTRRRKRQIFGGQVF